MSEYTKEPYNPYTGPQGRSDRHTVSTHAGIEFHISRKYELIKCIGEGSYGVVISVHNTEDEKKYAIKKIQNILQDIGNGFRVYREIEIMRHCSHPNVLGLVNVEIDPAIPNFTDLYMTMELMETDLSRVIFSNQALSDDHVQYFIYQILCGLKYLHSAHIIHRDLKPSNILVNENCDLKICDFNLARDEELVEDGYTEYVQTRWYRAPEVMLSSQNYSRSVDIWSVGCIMGELIKREVLFPGNQYTQQLKLYCDLIGLPEEQDLTFITNEKALKYILTLNRIPKNFADVFPDANPVALDLLQKMLILNPNKRITVDEALAHPYFDNLHIPELEIVCEKPFELHVNDQSIRREDLQKMLLKIATNI